MEIEFGSADLDLGFTNVHEYLASQEPPPDEPRTDEELSALLESFVISTSISTTHTKDLNELLTQEPYFAYSLVTLFAYRDATTDHGVTGYSASLQLKCRINGAVVKVLDAADCFPSKKHAREAAAALGLDYLRSDPAELAALPTSPPETCFLATDPVETENWVGELQGLCPPPQQARGKEEK